MGATSSKGKLPKGISQRENGLYCGRFKHNGESFVFYDRDLKALQKTLEDKKYEVKHGIYSKQSNIKLDEWYHEWMENYRARELKASTVATYNQVYRLHIQPVLGKKKLKDITTDQLQRFMNNLKDSGLSNSRVNIGYVLLTGMFKKAFITGAITGTNPMLAVEYTNKKDKKVIQQETRVLSLEEQATFLKYAQGSEYQDFYTTALCTGLRIGEVLALRWDDIDFQNDEIHVNGTLVYSREKKIRYIGAPKSLTSRRTVPMLPKVKILLKERQREQQKCKKVFGEHWKEEPGLENLVFTYPEGGAWWDTGIRVEMKKITEAIRKDGISFEDITPHDRVIIRTSQENPVNTRVAMISSLFFLPGKSGEMQAALPF